MTQEQMVIDYLREHKGNGLTQLEATLEMGITRLSGRIFELRNRGYVIETEMREVTNRYGQKCRVGAYHLIKEADGNEG